MVLPLPRLPLRHLCVFPACHLERADPALTSKSELAGRARRGPAPLNRCVYFALSIFYLPRPGPLTLTSTTVEIPEYEFEDGGDSAFFFPPPFPSLPSPHSD